MIENKLKELDILLPEAPDPVGAYVAYKKAGNLLFISGQLPISSDGKMIKGKIGKDLNLEDGKAASKLCVINILAQAKKALNGDLNSIKNCVKISRLVAPIAFRMPISLILSVTDTNIIFIIPIPPTRRDTPPIAANINVSPPVIVLTIERASF